jgi:plasmid stability protein
VDDDLLRRARIKALNRGTSVNAVLRDYLEAFAGGRESREEAMAALLRQSRRARSSRGGRRWKRDDLHER